MFDTRIVESTIGHWHKQDIYGTYNPKHLKRRIFLQKNFAISENGSNFAPVKHRGVEQW